MSDIESIKARLEKATKGEWVWTAKNMPIDIYTYESPGYYENKELRNDSGEGIITCGEYEVMERVEDADFIAHAKSDIAFLLSEVERLRGALKACRDNAGDWGMTLSIVDEALQPPTEETK